MKADNYFAVVPEWVLYHEKMSDQAVRLYATLQRYANSETGEAWPSKATLAAKLHRSPRSIQRTLEELRSLGAIYVMRPQDRERATTTYGVRTHTEGGEAKVSPPQDESGGEGEAKVSPNPEKLKKASTSARKRARDEVFEALAEGWIERPYSEIKGNLTRSQRQRINAATKELHEIGVTPEQVAVAIKGYRKMFPGMPATPQAITKHWLTLDGKAEDAHSHEWAMITEGRTYHYVCKDCGATSKPVSV